MAWVSSSVQCHLLGVFTAMCSEGEFDSADPLEAHSDKTKLIISLSSCCVMRGAIGAKSRRCRRWLMPSSPLAADSRSGRWRRTARDSRRHGTEFSLDLGMSVVLREFLCDFGKKGGGSAGVVH